MEYGIPTRPDFAGTFVLRRYGEESSTIRRVEKGLMDANSAMRFGSVVARIDPAGTGAY
jgi:hypothetical protein